MVVTINWEKAFELLDRLLEYYRTKQFPYDKAQVPQIPANMPTTLELGTREHALFLFCACYYMRGGIESHLAFRRLGRLYVETPDIFLPEWISEQVSSEREERVIEKLIETLRNNSLGFAAKANATFWVKNAIKLHEYWGDDPRTLFEGDPNFDELVRRLKGDRLDASTNFGGFREKMVSMIAYFYADAGFITEDKWPAPIDFHLLRVMTITEMLSIDGEITEDRYQPEYLEAARNLTLEFARKRNVSMVEVADVMWLLSGALCKHNPGNRMERGEYRARRTQLTQVLLTWKKSEVDAFTRSCLKCPVRSDCKWNVAAGPYYVGGRLEVIGRRQEPLQSDLFFPP